MTKRSFAAVFFFTIAANIPFWIASRVFGLELRGWFDLEFVLIGILSLFVRRRITVGLLLSAMLIDVLSSISWTYRLSVSEMFHCTSSLFQVASSRVGDLLIVLLGIAVIGLAMKAATPSVDANGRERIFVVSALAIFACVCGAVDTETGHLCILDAGHACVFRLDRQLGTIRLTRIPTHSYYRSVVDRRGIERLTAAGRDAAVQAASMNMVKFDTAYGAESSMQPNLVLILVESWGKPLAADLNESLLRPYSDPDLSDKYTLSQGSVPFDGPTVDGEARELCGSKIGFGLLTASVSQLKTCLPERLNAMGYHSLGIHGFSANMFERGEWYRRIGFEEVMFRDQLEPLGLPLCPGPFPGICDAAISSWIGDRLERSSDVPQFIYWVTLNSHLPVPVPNRVKAPPSCAEVKAAAQSEALCSWYQLEFNVHRSVTELALRNTGRPTVFLIVGDHAPPFASPALREQFSDRVVPYMMLVPKQNGIIKEQHAARPLIAGTHSEKRHGLHPKGGKDVPVSWAGQGPIASSVSSDDTILSQSGGDAR